MEGLLLMAVGIAIGWVAWGGLRRGEIPAGSKGFQAYRPRRDENPVEFYFFILLYICTAVGLFIYGVMVLLGMAEPPPLTTK